MQTAFYPKDFTMRRRKKIEDSFGSFMKNQIASLLSDGKFT